MISDTNKFIEKVLIDENSLDLKIKKLATYINDYYKDEDSLIMVGILKGSVIFMSELAKHVKVDCNLEFMSVSSYDGTKSTGNVKILKDLETDIEGKNVLLVEDIIDSGHTLKKLKTNLEKRDPKEVRIITLLDKPERRVADIKPEWYGFKIPDEFIVGYGMDYNERFRNLPFIGILKRSVYEGDNE
ncbi:hypoxanthine phosphoribosyltransferase [uncultured Anaerococcus sp.]|uniref:hypoxanthine phosphoribosyltransferase n=1 Tax=uncultured Anaerococcus sp. TaxID=293428 RepID=UPI002601EA8C|nr:hypoxanthine phosphoribosyltransferase [uncultured Anaerococcus sp.]